MGRFGNNIPVWNVNAAVNGVKGHAIVTTQVEAEEAGWDVSDIRNANK